MFDAILLAPQEKELNTVQYSQILDCRYKKLLVFKKIAKLENQ